MTSSSFCSHCGAEIPSGGISCGVCGYFMHEPADPSYDPYIPPLTYDPFTPPLAYPDQTRPLTIVSPLTGRYRLIEKLGEGGYGLVYKAWDMKGACFVAIKEISLTGLSAKEMIEVTDSFNREISILSNLRHKHLPYIYTHFTDPEHWYVVMEYLDGKTLEDRLPLYVGGRIPVVGVLTIGEHIAEVLDYLHTQNPPIVYRDVKPGNIVVTDKEELYLIDFGTARRYREGQKKDTGSLGSPGYAAPEQYGKAQTTPKTDVYGLGATLQTLLTGKEPLDIQVEGIPPDCEIPERLQMLIKRMMAKDTFMRPDMQEVRVVLQGIREEITEEKEKSYPFAWVHILWLFSVGALYNITILNGSDWIYWIIASILVIVGVSVYQLIKTQRRFSHKITTKEVLIALNKGSAHSKFFVFYGVWYWSNDSIASNLTAFLLFVGLYLIGGIVLRITLLQLLQLLRLQKAIRQKQDSSPAQVLQQQKHP